MKALTVWQPWAALIALGAKPYEFRGWRAPTWIVGRRIAIHAGARKVRKEEIAALIVRLKSEEAWTTALKPELALYILEKIYASPTLLPTSAVICTAIIGESILGTKVVSEFGGPVNDSDRDEHANWAWPLKDIEVLVPPEPAKGAQGFWNWRKEAA